jgi:hypothetical protein
VLGVKREAAINDAGLRARIEGWSVPGECDELPEPGPRRAGL